MPDVEKEGHENIRAERMRDDVHATSTKKMEAKLGGVCEKRAKVVDELLSKSADRVFRGEEAGPVVHAPMAQVHVQPQVQGTQGRSFIRARMSTLEKTVPKHATQAQPTSCPYTEKRGAWTGGTLPVPFICGAPAPEAVELSPAPLSLSRPAAFVGAITKSAHRFFVRSESSDE